MARIRRVIACPQCYPPAALRAAMWAGAQHCRRVIPAGLLRRSKALGYEGWKAGIRKILMPQADPPVTEKPDSHSPIKVGDKLHGNDRMKKACHSAIGGSASGGKNSAFCILHSAFPPAFTLIELIITVAISGIAILALAIVFQEALKNMERQRNLQSANLLVEDLMNEIRSKKYVDSDFPANFGPETWAGETARLYFDDVDDYDNWSESPPRTIEGVVMNNVSNFAWRVVVTNVPATNFNLSASPACAPNSTDFKRITVTVTNAAITVSNMSVKGRYD